MIIYIIRSLYDDGDLSGVITCLTNKEEAEKMCMNKTKEKFIIEEHELFESEEEYNKFWDDIYRELKLKYNRN